MKGHVPTPEPLADRMVGKLFERRTPESDDRILYPGAGTGPFIEAVDRYCDQHGVSTPEGIAVELDPELLEDARQRHETRNVEFLEADFLVETDHLEQFEYIIGNPPYVPIEDLSAEEKEKYKNRFDTAVGRFDLYLLFFDRSIELLAEEGRLVFVTPEKFEYVRTASPLRERLSEYAVTEIEHVAEDSFDSVTAYPTITTIDHSDGGTTIVRLRDETEHEVELPADGESWASTVRTGDSLQLDTGVTLGDICKRISPGVATGADKVFVTTQEEVPPQLDGEWTYPTISGKQLKLNDGSDTDKLFICPYREDGRLPPEDELGAFGDWAKMHRERLEDRSCVKKNKRPWYGWHENPPMTDLLQPKLLCQDIAEEPQFWKEPTGDLVPKHTVYYLVPEPHVDLDALLEYLNGPDARAWLEANCQRAANGYYRLQSRVMEDLPVPTEFGETVQETLV